MGIPGLWEILGDGELIHLADLSGEHFKRTGRPLRIAVDEAGWRFKNLTEWQVAQIRQKVPEANPIEKAILWRLLRLMRMNIQVLFVFDGPSRPWKHGSTAGHIDWKKVDLLRKTLDVLNFPHHRAPAEAEAECARLQQLGIVDAVWSDDGDSLMFGATMLIRDYREGGGKSAKKSDNMVRVYRADDIARKHGLNRQRLVLFVLLVGGDYDAKGLEGCGPKTALQAVRYDDGRLSQMLCEIPLRQLDSFTESLRDYFQNHSISNVYVPPKYPRDLHVKNYREPKVSTVEQAPNLRGLQKGWGVAIEESRLRPFLREKFNFWTRGYIKHILPSLLARALAQTALESVRNNLVFKIEFVYKRGVNAHDPCKERKITFSPLVATDVDLRRQPEAEDWSVFTGKDGLAFDPSQPAEAELPDYILEQGLGATEMQRLREEANKPKPRKRKANDTITDGSSHGGSTSTGTRSAMATASLSASTTAKKRRNAPKAAPATAPHSNRAKGRSEAVESTERSAELNHPCPPKRFRLPPGLQRSDSAQGSMKDKPHSCQLYAASSSQTLSANFMFDVIPNITPPSSQAHPDAEAWIPPLPGLGLKTGVAGRSAHMSRTPTNTRTAAFIASGSSAGTITPNMEAGRIYRTTGDTTHTANPITRFGTATPITHSGTPTNTVSRRQAVVLKLTSDDEDDEPPTLAAAHAGVAGKQNSSRCFPEQKEACSSPTHVAGGRPTQHFPSTPTAEDDLAHIYPLPLGRNYTPSDGKQGSFDTIPDHDYRRRTNGYERGTIQERSVMFVPNAAPAPDLQVMAREDYPFNTAQLGSVDEASPVHHAPPALTGNLDRGIEALASVAATSVSRPASTTLQMTIAAENEFTVQEKRRKEIAAARLKHFTEMGTAPEPGVNAAPVGVDGSAPAARESAEAEIIDLTLDD